MVTDKDHEIIIEDGKVIKLFNKDVPKKKVLKEALRHAIVEEAGMKLPELYQVTVIDGRWAIVREYIEGKSYAQLIEENPEKADELIEEFVDIQIEIMGGVAGDLSSLNTKLNKAINANKDINEINKYELLTRLDAMPRHTKLIHGDYTLDHVIKSGNEAYIINWENAHRGNGSADVANSYIIMSLHNKELAEKYLDTYCKFTFTAKPYVQKWIPIMAAYRSSFEEKKDVLYRIMDVVQY